MSVGTRDDAVAAILDRVRTEVLDMARTTAADQHLDLQDMPTEIRDVEVPQTARLYLTRNLDAIAEDRLLTEDELDHARRRAVRRAQEGFPVGLLLHYWARGVEVLWQRCVAAARPEEADGLAAIASRLFALMDQQVCAVADAHREARTAIDQHERGAAPLAARLLIAGQDATTPAQQAGIDLAPCYDVLAVDLAPNEDEHAARAAGLGVARQRKVLRIITALDADAPAGLLNTLGADGGHVLVPRRDGTSVDTADCRRILDVIGAAAGCAAFAATGFAATRDAIPEAAEHASEVLHVVRRTTLPPGLYDVTSVPLDYQLSRPGSARDHLVRILDPLDPHPELLETVSTLLERNSDRGRTARALGVHPNTINNRLARIKDLLGIDPVSTHGVVTLSAALTARRLITEEST